MPEITHIHSIYMITIQSYILIWIFSLMDSCLLLVFLKILRRSHTRYLTKVP